MKIVSWNVNGLRAIHRKGNWEDLLSLNADIICLQETKAEPDQLADEVRNPEGYYSYFSHPTNGKKGYSGVAIYSKKEPDEVTFGMEVPEFDNEGRLITAFFDKTAIINIYFPNGGGGPVRLAYKLDFYDEFLSYIEKLRKEGFSIIFCGDVNTAHEEIDLARPKENEKNTGFLPEERAWIDEVINHGYRDIWRDKNPNKKDQYTYWDMKTGARDRNVGWRIDYFFISPDLIKKVKDVDILDNMLGSDHCPLLIDISLK